jgi:hypothetical protein
METTAVLSDQDHSEALALAHRIIASIANDHIFPLAVGDPSTRFAVWMMARCLVELSMPALDNGPVRTHVFLFSPTTTRCQICNIPEELHKEVG